MKELTGHNQPDANAEQATDDDLDGGMADEFAEAFFGEGFALKGFVDHLVEDARLEADGAADSGGVVHNDAGKYYSDGKGDGIDTGQAASGGGQAGYEGGMRAGHATGGYQAVESELAVANQFVDGF